jgi:hypothetical protein
MMFRKMESFFCAIREARQRHQMIGFFLSERFRSKIPQPLKKTMTKKLLTLLPLSLIGAVGLQGQILAVYNFNNSVDGATPAGDIIDLSASSVDPLISSSGLVSSLGFAVDEAGGPVNPTATTNGANQAGQNPYIHNGSVNNEVRNIDGSFAFNIPGRATRNDNEQTLSFTVTPDAGIVVDLESFSFNIRQSGDSAGNGPNNFRVLVNDTQIGAIQSHNTSTVTNLSFDLSSVSSLNAPFTVTLGMEGGGGTNRSAVLDDLTLSGTAVIPEPSTYAALFGLFALGCVAWRRRRAR